MAHPLSALGGESDADALLVLPKGYVDMRVPTRRLAAQPLNKLLFFQAKLTARAGYDENRASTRSPFPSRLCLTLQFDNGQFVGNIFGRANTGQWREIKVGSRLTFTAKVTIFRGERCLTDISLATATGKVHALYGGMPGRVSADVVTACLGEAAGSRTAQSQARRRISDDPVIVSSLRQAGYGSAGAFLRDLHTPLTPADGERALAAARAATVAQVRSAGGQRPSLAAPFDSIPIDDDLRRLVPAQPETLSSGQRNALNLIRKAIKTHRASRVLLNGDVGSGKTLVFLLAAASVAESGFRVAVMVPSELVARQIHAQAARRFPALRPALVTGADTRAEPGDSLMVIGTQALLSRPPAGPLRLLVIDEQHKFSVEQRAALAGDATHVIEASATPIPRSLALALFDGWIEAKIPGCPVEKRIHCHLLHDMDRGMAVRIVGDHLVAGRKVVFLYAKLAAGKADTKSAMEAAARLEQRFAGKVVCLHGKLKSADKEYALADFASGRKPILVSTTVIEVGVDVPDIGCMVVSSAERFGVAQLHQLRGRLVRNGGDGDFVMLTDKPIEGSGTERLRAVRDIADGFELAERDMHLRGFGDVLGEMQSGSAQTLFKMARLEASDFLPH
ncbi:MAG: DEAD/DEAH box helicase [Burkholderiaceae bacterium]|nr:MAG: DEAD/DEAH box helicase [Burkholderiaceae bacterium]